MTSATDDAQALVPLTTDTSAVVAPARGRWISRLAPWGRPAAARSRLDFPAGPSLDVPLHVVTGPHAQRVARGVLELAARFLAAGESVLVIDGSPRLALHARLGCAATPGLVDATEYERAVRDLVAPTACPGCSLLAHGDPLRHVRWPRFAMVYESARAEASRVILGLALDAPRAAGRALAGTPLTGWWAAPDLTCRPAKGFARRQRIPLSDIELDPMLEPSLDGLRRRSRTLSGSRARTPVPVPDARLLDPVVVEVAAPEPIPSRVAFAPPPESADVFDGDPRVRERLRFLMWTRRMHADAPPPEFP
jgi:hypothetical protein